MCRAKCVCMCQTTSVLTNVRYSRLIGECCNMGMQVHAYHLFNQNLIAIVSYAHHASEVKTAI